MTERVCQGCGTTLPPTKRQAGQQRKWCSERCRKAQYDLACIDCGARVDGTTPSRCGGRCMTCAQAKRTLEAREEWSGYRRMIEEMWAEGMTQRQIVEALELKPHTAHIGLWRSRGYNLPYRRTGQALANVLAGSVERMEHARACRKAAA